MKKFSLIVCLLLLGCANINVPYTTYESAALGISFAYPESWILQASELEVNIATDESLFQAETADFSGGAVVNFSTLPLSALNGEDIEVAMRQFTSFVAASEAVEEAVAVDLFTLSGREAAQARVNLSAAATLLVVMIEDKEQMILVAAVYDAAHYEEEMVQLVEGIIFNE